ncbi:hypothetical protein [Pseudonocardia aurantiaca]|uniref:Uncharacterized protein n=1 Tax=Pseudonocardia aurantiaca TaxID=75290 RepID=A0ABW4FDX1_9PSEU
MSKGGQDEDPIRDMTVITALFADPRHRSVGRPVLAFDAALLDSGRRDVFVV